jgi:hypothetical protein
MCSKFRALKVSCLTNLEGSFQNKKSFTLCPKAKFHKSQEEENITWKQAFGGVINIIILASQDHYKKMVWTCFSSWSWVPIFVEPDSLFKSQPIEPKNTAT